MGFSVDSLIYYNLIIGTIAFDSGFDFRGGTHITNMYLMFYISHQTQSYS